MLSAMRATPFLYQESSGLSNDLLLRLQNLLAAADDKAHVPVHEG